MMALRTCCVQQTHFICGLFVASADEEHAGALGGGGWGAAALCRAITFPAIRPLAREICLNATNFAGRQRKGESPNATLALEIIVVPWLPAGGAAPTHCGSTAVLGAGSGLPLLPVATTRALHEVLPCPQRSKQNRGSAQEEEKKKKKACWFSFKQHFSSPDKFLLAYSKSNTIIYGWCV